MERKGESNGGERSEKGIRERRGRTDEQSVPNATYRRENRETSIKISNTSKKIIRLRKMSDRLLAKYYMLKSWTTL